MPTFSKRESVLPRPRWSAAMYLPDVTVAPHWDWLAIGYFFLGERHGREILGALVLFALEGVICVAMAWPIALAVAFPGAVLGRVMATRGVTPSAGASMALIVPLWIGVEPRATPPS